MFRIYQFTLRRIKRSEDNLGHLISDRLARSVFLPGWGVTTVNVSLLAAAEEACGLSLQRARQREVQAPRLSPALAHPPSAAAAAARKRAKGGMAKLHRQITQGQAHIGTGLGVYAEL